MLGTKSIVLTVALTLLISVFAIAKHTKNSFSTRILSGPSVAGISASMLIMYLIGLLI